MDVPAGVTQEEGHKGFLIHLPSAVLAIIFLARRVQLFISLVDREVEFIVLHLDLLGVFLFWFFLRGKIPVIGPRTEPPGRPLLPACIFLLNFHTSLCHSDSYRVGHVVVVVVSRIQRIGCQPEKTTLHDGQSRSWSAEQGKENKRRSLAAYPPPNPPHCSFGKA